MTDPIIEIRDLRFSWPGRNAFAIAVPQLEIARGERVLLFGPSGGGKSTLLSLICGILQPDSGRLQVLGNDLAGMGASKRDRFRAEHIGVIFQQFNLLPYGSLMDNILLPLSFAPKRAKRANADGGGAVEEVRRLLDALNLGHVPTGKRASELSIGQQQRVAVARALIGAPELVIADEPTSALDTHAQDRFLTLLFEQLQRTSATLLMVSHDERLADRFDRVIQLGDVVQLQSAEAA